MKTKGFTLIESLVAITILTVTVTALLFSASRGIIAAQNARNQLTASYLAQEGIEYVRMMRDNEYLTKGTAKGWTKFTASGNNPWSIAPCNKASTKICALNDPTNNDGSPQLRQCTADNANSCTATFFSLYRSSSSGVYISPDPRLTLPDGATQTPFNRSIQATIVSPTEVRIDSRVWWYFHGTIYSVTISENLTPWQ